MPALPVCLWIFVGSLQHRGDCPPRIDSSKHPLQSQLQSDLGPSGDRKRGRQGRVGGEGVGGAGDGAAAALPPSH